MVLGVLRSSDRKLVYIYIYIYIYIYSSVLAFFYYAYYDLLGVQYAFICSSFFLPQPTPLSKVTKYKLLL